MTRDAFRDGRWVPRFLELGRQSQTLASRLDAYVPRVGVDGDPASGRVGDGLAAVAQVLDGDVLDAVLRVEAGDLGGAESTM